MLENFGHESSGPSNPRDGRSQGRVILAVKTNWNESFLHYKTANGGWNRLPGTMLVERDDNQFPGYHMVSLDDCPIEFALNDGMDNWASLRFSDPLTIGKHNV